MALETDTDLEPIRKEAAFQALLGEKSLADLPSQSPRYGRRSRRAIR